LAFSPDSRFLATARGKDFAPPGTPVPLGNRGRLCLWEVLTGQEVLAFPVEAQPTLLVFTSEGRSLITGSKEGQVVLWNLAHQDQLAATAELTREELQRLWTVLDGEDAPAAYRAFWKLRAGGPKVLRFLKERLQTPSPEDPGLNRLIADLGAASFDVREAARRQLEQQGANAEPGLRRALASAASPAHRQRILMLLDAPGIVQHFEARARTRALAVLEAIASPEAREILETLARESPLTLQAQEAKRVVERWNRR
jgi:hypothetical protein